ncbi:class II fructose-bisphosphate aldolase, partial [Acinetobacter baumannii]|nr:class II fructose-bisphosphate aldolase [Acinetobacter baumannii]
FEKFRVYILIHGVTHQKQSVNLLCMFGYAWRLNALSLPLHCNIGETYGVPVEQLVEAIKHGVRKINIDTDLRLA